LASSFLALVSDTVNGARKLREKGGENEMKAPKKETPPGYQWVFRAWKTLPDGSRLYARQFGKKAFCFLVKVV
jgi:hypothetical protein